jgi:hypothetical protein
MFKKKEAFMFDPISYEGFSPSEALKKIARDQIFRLEAESPSDSSTQARVSKSENSLFEGKLRINSTAGSFFAHVRDCDPEKVVSHLCEQVRQQLFSWKRKRVFPRL